MSINPKVTLDSIAFKNDKTAFTDGFELEIVFALNELLDHPLVWKIIYVGSAVDEKYDQVLE